MGQAAKRATASAPAPRLTDSLQLGRGPTIANRLVRASLSEALGDREGRPTPALLGLYGRWAVERGHGLILTGNVMVDGRHLGEPGNVVVQDERDLACLRAWADVARGGGALVWMQINHAGRQALPHLTGNRTVAPSAVRPPIPGAVTPRALLEDEIWDIVRRFANTARIARLAGFDGVQLHGAHGYLISQFLSPLANRRDDAWGGDAQRRMRFVLEVLRATRAAVGDAFPIGIKLNSSDFLRGGFDEAESMAVVDALQKAGIDMVEVSGGTYGSPAMMGKGVAASTRQREAYFQEYALEVRRRTQGLPLMLTGGFRTRAAMERALEDGACDLVGIARATCTDPEIGAKILASSTSQAKVAQQRAGARWLLGRFTDLRPIDGAIDLQWHTDQMHRMSAGQDPDLTRAWYQTVARMIRRNGLAGLRRKRG
jgi:2,4-dienoyl-CoA reductase-like NADH-dependent reductase (Old Yellow Enzyme family)